jgi:hypothetical protein
MTGEQRNRGTVHKTIRLLEHALRMLGADLPETDVESIGVMINRAMSAQERSFHTPEHIFDLADSDDPYLTLAALFHDLVYYQVDHGFGPQIGELLEPYIAIDDGSVSIAPSVSRDKRAFWGAASVFGFSPGQTLSPFAGLNEFLSALVMCLLLEGSIDDRDLLVATACIEATIPFRGVNDAGKTPPEALEMRLEATDAEYGLGLDADRVREIVRSATRFANRDVRNFAEKDVGRFLDNTWKLLPETNPELRVRGVYSISSYRIALQKMEGFLGFLDPATIFQVYRGEPREEEYAEMHELAARNVNTARRYLGIKLLTAGVLEALALLSGGDAPVAFFMGDIAPEGDKEQLSDYLPKPDPRSNYPDAEQRAVDKLLAVGRTSESDFDLQNSPLALFVFRRLGSDPCYTCLESAKAMFGGKKSAEEFLSDLPAPLVCDIASASARMAFTRSEALEAIARSYRG